MSFTAPPPPPPTQSGSWQKILSTGKDDSKVRLFEKPRLVAEGEESPSLLFRAAPALLMHPPSREWTFLHSLPDRDLGAARGLASDFQRL